MARALVRRDLSPWRLLSMVYRVKGVFALTAFSTAGESRAVTGKRECPERAGRRRDKKKKKERKKREERKKEKRKEEKREKERRV